MDIKWTFPKLKMGFNPPAVYRIDFDNGFFYVGGSKHVKTRMSSWRTVIKSDRFYSKAIGYSIKGATSAIFYIIEITTLESLRDRETFHIREHFANEFCLNQSSDGHLTQGLKPIPDHLKRPKKEKKPPKARVLKGRFRPPANHVWAFSKGVVQFDMDGNYIRSHKSISDAAKSIGVHPRTINKHLKSKTVRGISDFIFKLCGDNSSRIVIKKTIKQKPIIEISGRLVIDLNTGVFYYSAQEAAAQTNWKLKYFYKMLSGEKPNKTQFRYA